MHLSADLHAFGQIKVVSCADINSAATKARAREFGIAASSIDSLLKDESVQIVLNHYSAKPCPGDVAAVPALAGARAQLRCAGRGNLTERLGQCGA
jgi:hypothetical protein